MSMQTAPIKKITLNHLQAKKIKKKSSLLPLMTRYSLTYLIR